MVRMRYCVCLLVIILLLLFRIEALPLNPNMKDKKNRSLSSSSLLALIKDRYVPRREIPGGPRVLGEVVPLNRGPVPPSSPNPITHEPWCHCQPLMRWMVENVQLMHKVLLIFNEHIFCNIFASTAQQQFKVKFFIIIDQFFGAVGSSNSSFIGCSSISKSHVSILSSYMLMYKKRKI